MKNLQGTFCTLVEYLLKTENGEMLRYAKLVAR